MAHLDLEAATSRCRAIRDFVVLNPGGRDNARARQRMQELLGALGDTIEDGESQRLIRDIQGYSSDLFSARGHHGWRQGMTSGADVLRLQILRALDAFRDRLSAIAQARPGGNEQDDSGFMRV